MQLEILAQRAEIMPFVGAAIAEADKDKESLGFFPSGVFHEFAQRELLLIAAASDGAERKYAGHLLFNCRFPKAHVLQIVTTPEFRKLGIAHSLLEFLKKWLTSIGFISVYARVASDLQNANSFWERQGFFVQSMGAGGTTRKRTILNRSCELASPQLFSQPGVSLTHPLGVAPRATEEKPTYLLDLNVLFDLGQRRPRNADVLKLFKADRAGAFDLALSSEFGKELARTAKSGKTDPMLMFARIYPVFSLVETTETQELFDDLVKLVFPNNAGWLGLSESQKSDLRHVATAIQSKLTGVVTSDESMLAAAYAIGARFGVEVVSPLALRTTQATSPTDQEYETNSEQKLSVRPIEKRNLDASRELILRAGIAPQELERDWVNNSERISEEAAYGVWDKSQLIGYLHCLPWRKHGKFVAKLVIDEGAASARGAAKILLQRVLDASASGVVTRIALRAGQPQTKLREVAWSLGFRDIAGGSEQEKIRVGTAITPKNWADVRQQLRAVSEVRLPEELPTFLGIDQQIQVITGSGERIFLTLENLETLLSPVIFCVPGRPIVLTPIRREFSQALLGHSRQMSFLPQSKATMYAQRHYMSANRNLKKFSVGGLILFYESAKQRGMGSVVGMARVRRAYQRLQSTLDGSDFDPSVLNASTLRRIGNSKSKTVTSFDNFLVFNHPVTRETLKRIDCGRPNDLISTTALSYEQALTIIEEGFRSE